MRAIHKSIAVLAVLGMCFVILAGCNQHSVTLSDLEGRFCMRHEGTLVCFEFMDVVDKTTAVKVSFPEQYQEEWGVAYEVAPNTIVCHLDMAEGSVVMVLVASDSDTLNWTLRSMDGSSEGLTVWETGQSVLVRQ